MNEKEKSSGQAPIVTTTTKALQLRQVQGRGGGDGGAPNIDASQPPRKFLFDQCYGESSNDKVDTIQQELFDDIGKDLVANAFDGFNCSVFAYGQTGSGKTYTMVGDKSATGKGLIPRICEALFDEIEKARVKESDTNVDQHKTVFGVHMNYCEIYKEKVKDLLDETKPVLARTGSQPLSPLLSPEGDGRTLKIREHPVHGPFVEGLITRSVGSYAEIEEELLAGQKLRTVAATLMNPTSSRSHAIFTLIFTQTRVDPVTLFAHEKTSKICLVDLAGSERSDTSGTSGERLKEASMINKSLFTLGRVISSLGAKERIPYRDSTLTWLLKESLGGNSKTTMLAMVSPSSGNYEETLSTLRYAESAKKIINRVVVNEDQNAAIIRQLRQQIEDLKGQLLSSQRRRSSETSVGLVKSLLEREELLGQLQRDAKRNENCILLPVAHPSLINLQEDLLENEPLAHVLEPGLTVLGSNPTPSLDDWKVDSPLGDIFDQTESQAVHPMHLVHDAENLLPLHAKILNDKGFLTVEPWPSAMVLVNDVHITSFTTLKHRDRLQIGDRHFFRVFVPCDALFRRNTSKTDNHTDEANSLCVQAGIPYRFQREVSSDVSIRMDDDDSPGITWERSLFLERLQTLRAYNADNVDKETLVSMLGLPPIRPVEMPATDEEIIEKDEVHVEVQTDTVVDDDHAHTDQLSVEIPPTSNKIDPFFEIRSNAVRLMGQARLYVGFGISGSAAHDNVLQGMYRVISVFDPVGTHVASITLELVYELKKEATKTPESLKWTVKILWKEVRFYVASASEGIYITYQLWDQSKQGSTPKCTSSTGVFALSHSVSCDIVCPKTQSLADILQGECVGMDVWGWGRIPASPPASIKSTSSSDSVSTLASTRQQHAVKVDVFVSVDVEERMQDGLFTPVSVKDDGTLRLSQNSSRRITIRVVQADQQPFCLQSISQIRLAPEQNIGHAKGMTQFEAATVLGSSTLGGFFKRYGAKEVPLPAEDWSLWSTLAFRTPLQIDPEARSIVCTMKWEVKGPETVSVRGQRRVFRVALALETTLSAVPAIVSTKFTTKCLAKLKKETAWWAREQVSRMHRLGHWFAIDVGKEEMTPSDVVAEKLLDHYGQGMEKLQVAHALEQFRQQLVAENALKELTSERQHSISTSNFLLQRQSDEWVIQSTKFPDLAVHVASGVTMCKPGEFHYPHVSQAITDPTSLDPFAGEMSGYLMLNASMAWNRRWFVLQRPLLYCYKTFAKNDLVGVLDISKCELVVDKDALFPFSFRLTSTVEKTPLTWQLQASTADEMRVWNTSIKPSKGAYLNDM
ncbi:Aste57867_8379 [Aphanomyces stellatus]|uniref:Aste57867_8379 protein n=1 Tax=Aphanomyces stellatus TaxID=120398 RepID=A0A485KK52_9STRA|nr:hypothetical protein As57867_008347 [Aphanomyces stellatus]VFT85265.1 Aste57867_8379 [Aphanomyces stellatus]